MVDDIKLYLRKIGCEYANWIELTQNIVQWAFVLVVMYLRTS